MSKTKSRNTLLSTHNRTSHGNSIKDELISMKYQMDKPEVPIYMLSDSIGLDRDEPQRKESEYPDFHPWKDHTELFDSKKEKEVQKMSNASYLNKGYYETPHVSNEYHSARILIQATLFSSTNNCNSVLQELSQHLANAYKTRNEGINKIRYENKKTKVMTRVTLTASKKEAWIKDLANPTVPFSKLADKLPHGIRNKVLIDILSTRNVPILRGIWFTKLVLYNECILQKRKYQSRTSSAQSPTSNNLDITSEKFESIWLQEWTQQVVDYVAKISKEMSIISSAEKKSSYMNKFNYIISYSQALYIEGLLDRNYFLSSFFHSLKEGIPQDFQDLMSFSRLDSESEEFVNWAIALSSIYGQKLVSLTMVKVFWNDIIKVDYLCKDLSESLLLNYFHISKIYSGFSKITHSQNTALIPQGMIQQLIDLISSHIVFLFKHNTNHFIIPNFWSLLSESLYRILLGDGVKFEDETEQAEIHKQLQLVNYRNESLMLNKRQLQTHQSNPTSQRNINRRGSFLSPRRFSSTNFPNSITKLPSRDQVDDECTIINRSSNDILKIINQLDKLELNDELAESLKPHSTFNDNSQDWKMHLRLVVLWCITPFRESMQSGENILIVCNFFKRKVIQSFPAKNSNTVKVEFENEVFEIIYDIVEKSNIDIVKNNLYILINELYQLKIITISAYLRKLIASGIFYSSPGDQLAFNPEVNVHISILKNLPVLNNTQCNNILRKWTSEGFDFQNKFDVGKNILKNEIVDKFLNDNMTEFGKELNYLKELNVGLKFLLINWLTNELRSSISKSSQLVHLNPLVISLLYEFYRSCDNLTIFFKVLVKLLLRNEGKMLIFYMDSLYLIAKLVINHFKLIKCIAGTSQDSLATGYELFRLILNNYKDLASRDADIPQFQNIWKFIDVAVETSGSANKPNRIEQSTQKSVFIESPLKITPTENKNQDFYSLKEFKSDLELLTSQSNKVLNAQQVMESFASLNIDCNLDAYYDATKIRANVQVQIKAFLKIITLQSENGKQVISKLLLDLKHLSGKEFADVFFFSLKDYIKVNKVDKKSLISFLKHICVYEILTIDIVSSYLKDWNDHLDGEWSQYYFDLNFSERNGNSDLSLYHRTIFNSIQDAHLHKLSNTLLMAFLEDLNTSASKIHNTYSISNYGNLVILELRRVLTVNSKFAIDELVNKASSESHLDMINLMLGLKEGTYIKTFSDLCKSAAIINEFNLPIIQFLLKVLFTIESKDSEDNSFMEKVETFLDDLSSSVEYQFTTHNSYFGELFNYLFWEHKVKVLYILEIKFLKDTLFRLEADDNEPVRLADSRGRSLQPVLKDYFKKFSLSSINKIPTTKDFYERLVNFSFKLLSLVNIEHFKDREKSLYNTVSIFLRILIVHKLTLSQAIANFDSSLSFVKNLIILLNSDFFNQNEKLKILLYDLLHLTRSSLSLEVNAKSELQENADASSLLHSPGHNANSQSRAPDDVSPVSINNAQTSLQTQIASVFDLPEPNKVNPLRNYLKTPTIECAIMLTEEELDRAGDLQNINNYGLVLTSSRKEHVSLSPDFGIMDSTGARQKAEEFNLRGFEILEDTSTSLNDGYINLSLFDAYTTKENPP